MEQPLVITNREELLFMLSEAAQLEHMLLCEYLFAAFSLKRSTDEGLTPAQVDAVRRWDKVITAVAVQEMLHLALVTNLLTAVGGAPYLGRPNFPQRAKYFPPGIQLALLPFGEHTLRHFLYLERPEGMTLEDAPEFELLGSPAPVAPDETLVPLLEEFATVGHLYRGIERGFETLVERHGERGLFIGPAQAQATMASFGWPELIAVTDLATATQAIATIVEEGEGARGDWSRAHYGRFLGVLEEYLTLQRQDPAFAPARPVAACMVRPPADVDTATPITEPATAGVAALFNASYEVMLQVLHRYFVHTEETPAQLQTLSRTAMTLMRSILTPLGRRLTRMPIGAATPGQTAGPSFEIYRTGYLLPHRDAAWIVLRERLEELAAYGERLITEHSALEDLAGVVAHLHDLASVFSQHHIEPSDISERAPDEAVTPVPSGEMVAPGFAAAIRPLFRENDVRSMAWAFDLSSYEAVRTHAEGIYARLSAGTMPCDNPWPAEHVALFKQWMDAGCSA